MGERSKMRPGKRLIAGAAALVMLSPACTSGSNESGPKSPATTAEAPAPPVKSFEELTRRTAETITCMLTSEKTRLIPSNENDGGLISAPGQPAALLQADRYLPPARSLGAWQGYWEEPGGVPGEGIVMGVSVEGFVPPDSPYWQGAQLTAEAVQAGVRDMKGHYLSTVIVPFEADSDGFDAGAMAYFDPSFKSSPADRDPDMLSTADPHGKWRPATEEDVKRLEQDVNQVLGALMTESQITDCGVKP